MAPVEAVLEATGLHARRVEAARRFGMAAPTVVGLARKKNRAAALRCIVEGGRGTSEERSGARRNQGGLAALQSAARVAGGRGNRRRRRCQDSGEVGGRR